jgi:rhodanese-related sulfurtransferase
LNHRLQIALLLLALIPACAGDGTSPGPSSLSPDVLKGWLERNAPVVLFDVRPDSLFDTGRIAGSIRSGGRRVADLREVLPLDPAVPIVVLDQTGISFRSEENLAAELSHFGFPKVYWLEGGIDAWETKGYELIGFRTVSPRPR